MARDDIILILEPEESETEKKRKKRQAELDRIFYDTMTNDKSDAEASRKT